MTYQNEAKIVNGSEERKYKILNLISDNEPIHHNALKKLILDNKIAATKTFDKIMGELSRSGTIKSEEKGNKKFYSIKKNFEFDIERFKKDIHVDLMIIKTDMVAFEHVIDDLDEINRSSRAFFLLKLILHAANKILIFIFLNSENKDYYEKKLVILEKHVRKIFRILKNDKNAAIVYPLVWNNLFPRQVEFTMNPNLK